MKTLESSSPISKSADLVAENIQALKALFPEAFTEGGVDFTVLKELLGKTLLPEEEKEEKYGLNWFGKRKARQLALNPSMGTLRPCLEDSVDWDTTKNIMIEGDNLEVLKLLQKSYAGKVKLIYIDPPYNTGKDFVYPDNFQDNIKNYLELTGKIEGGRKLEANTDASGRFHTDWLNMMYPRLKLARNLLTDDGVIFISIDDGEVSGLRSIMDEIFGEENFQACISWQKRYTRSNNTIDFTTMIEYVVTYSKSELFSVNLLERTKEADARYSNPDGDPRGQWKGASFLNPASPDQRPNLCYPITNPHSGKVTNPTTSAWRRSENEFVRLQSENRLYWGRDGLSPLPSIKMFLSEARNITPVNFWDHDFAGNTDDGTRDLKELMKEKTFDNPKPVLLIRRIIEHATSTNDIMLDFYAGSGTTGHAVMAQNAADGGNRRYILVQLPEPLDPNNKDQKTAADLCTKLDRPLNIAELTKERLRRAGKKIAEENPMFKGDLGFRVFKLDESNIRSWEPEWDNLEEIIRHSVDHIKESRSEEDVLFELLLKLGLDLSVIIEKKEIAGKMVHSIGSGVLMVCLAQGISREDVESLALGIVEWRKTLAPVGETRLVFRDSAFVDDVAKTNMVAILEQNSITNVRSL